MTSRQLLSNTFTEIISVDCSQETISIESKLVGNVTICMKKKTQWPRTCLHCTTYVGWLFVKMDWTYIKLECYNYISGLFSKGYKKLVANIFLAVVYDCIL